MPWIQTNQEVWVSARGVLCAQLEGGFFPSLRNIPGTFLRSREEEVGEGGAVVVFVKTLC